MLALGLLLAALTPARVQEVRIELGPMLPPCRETRGQLPGGALSYDYTKALLARLEACAHFNRRFMAEVGPYHRDPMLYGLLTPFFSTQRFPLVVSQWALP